MYVDHDTIYIYAYFVKQYGIMCIDARCFLPWTVLREVTGFPLRVFLLLFIPPQSLNISSSPSSSSSYILTTCRWCRIEIRAPWWRRTSTSKRPPWWSQHSVARMGGGGELEMRRPPPTWDRHRSEINNPTAKKQTPPIRDPLLTARWVSQLHLHEK